MGFQMKWSLRSRAYPVGLLQLRGNRVALYVEALKASLRLPVLDVMEELL